jgi:hypothetical protein
VIREPYCEGLWTKKIVCGPEPCKELKVTKKQILEGTKPEEKLGRN